MTLRTFALLLCSIVPWSVSVGACPSTTETDARNEVRDLLESLAHAIATNDVDSLARLWADGYRYVRKDGVTMTKKQRIDRVRGGVARHDLVRYLEPDIHVYGCTAWILARTISRSEGAVTAPELQVSHVAVKDGQRWQVVLTHATEVRASPLD